VLTDKTLSRAFRITVLAWIVVALAILASDARACDFDIDCDVGSRCRGGVCVGGLWPGNDNDDAPLRGYDRPLWDLSETYGDTCSFDTDCGIAMRCARRRGALEGVCVRAR